MSALHIDIETYSSVSLPDAGVYAYTASPDFRILLFAYAFDNEAPQLIDLATEQDARDRMQKILPALLNPEITKKAYNAQFERVCLSAYFRLGLDPAGWYCVAAHAAQLSLPPSLDACAKLLLPATEHKHAVGRRLIRYFCIPCASTSKNGGRTRNLPGHAPEDWMLFREYCKQDVAAERALEAELAWAPFVAKERELYTLDQRINDRGIRVDPKLVHAAIKCDYQYKAKLEAEALELAGLDKMKSAQQVKAWLNANAGDDAEEVTSLTKETLPGLLKDAGSDKIRRILEIRQELTKTSVQKYAAMARALGPDDRVRGLLQYYGASRTGRWSGRLVQVQNLPQNHMDDLGYAREMLRRGDFAGLELLYGPPPFVLSEMIRTAFIPGDNCRFVVADFSAIEARVIAWLADEKWALDEFRGKGKIYEATAAQMFKVPVEKITRGNPEYALRAKGKVAVLACGFGGGAAALERMDSLHTIPLDELPGLVNIWRRANPNIVRLWADVEDAATEAIETGRPHYAARCTFKLGPNAVLRIQLPSGRSLSYQNARLGTNKWGRTEILYDGIGQERKSWGELSTYGGKLTENIVQAIARDCLATAMTRLTAGGYTIVMHVHDEVVLDTPRWIKGALKEACEIMGRPIDWAPGLPLCAAGFECEFYQKD